MAPYNGGTLIVKYTVQWNQGGTDDDFIDLQTSFNVSTLTLTQTGLTAGETYKFRIIAGNFIGDSPASTAAVIIAATVPLQPQAPIKLSADETSISIRWFAQRQDNGSNVGFSGGSPIIKYRVYYDGTGSYTLLAEHTDVVTLQYTLTSATTGNTYGFKVSAVNVVGEGP